MLQCFRFSVVTLIFLLSAGGYSGSAFGQSTDADLRYFADTGEIKIYNPDPAVAQVVLTGGPFLTDHFVSPPSTSSIGLTETSISILFIHPQPDGPVSLGALLAPDLSQQDFLSRFESATSNSAPMTLSYVPEPTSLSLAVGLGWLLMPRRRRD